MVKPGGHLIITVPDEDLYEKGFWPSRFNPSHKWSFTICKQQSWNQGHSVNVLDLCYHCAAVAEVEKVELIRDFFNEQWPREADQTARTLTADVRHRADSAQTLSGDGADRLGEALCSLEQGRLLLCHSPFFVFTVLKQSPASLPNSAVGRVGG